MKKVYILVFYILVLTGFVHTINAQTASAGRYEARLVHDSYNCSKDSVLVCLQIRSTSVDSNFIMGNANFLIQYNHNVLDAGSAIIRSRGIYSGGTNYSTISLTNNPGTTSSAISINVVNIGENGAGQSVDTTWRNVACLAFSQVNNASNCYSLNLSASNPTTIVTMAMVSTDPNNPMSEMKVVTQGTLTSITNQCPVGPIAFIAGGGTIVAGGSSTITVASTNNVLPATVIISDISNPVELTTQQPSASISVSPTQTTTYNITNVSNSCATGSAETGKQLATVVVNGVTPVDCSMVKCAPVTIVIIK